MNCRIINQCLEAANQAVSFATLDAFDPSCVVYIDVSGGSGNGSVKVYGVHNSNNALWDRSFENTTNFLNYTEDLQSAAWPKERCTVTREQEATTPNFSKSSLYFELTGDLAATAIPDIYQLDAIVAAATDYTLDENRTVGFSLAVKQPSADVSVSACKIALYNYDATGATGSDRLHSLRVYFPTYGEAPVIDTESDAATNITFSSIESLGDDWYKITLGVNSNEYTSGEEESGDKLRPVIYLGRDNDSASYQGKKLWVKEPLGFYTDKLSPTTKPYFPVLTGDSYNFDALNPVIDQTITTGKYMLNIQAYPKYQIDTTNLDTTNANIKVYLVSNAL